jgi:hypothetical protein
VALPQSEIAQLQNAGISVEVLDSVELDLSHGVPLADIATGFVIWRTEAAAKDPESTLEGVLAACYAVHTRRVIERSHDLKTAISSRAKEDDDCSFCMEISQKPTLIRK